MVGLHTSFKLAFIGLQGASHRPLPDGRTCLRQDNAHRGSTRVKRHPHPAAGSCALCGGCGNARGERTALTQSE